MEENLPLLRAGIANLTTHIQTARKYGVSVVVAVNKFGTDTESELALIEEQALTAGATAAVVTDHWAHGGKGALALSEAVVKACDEPSQFDYLYRLDTSIKEKIETICREVYGAADVDYSATASRQIADFERAGFGYLPICMAKTHLSISPRPGQEGGTVWVHRPRGERSELRWVQGLSIRCSARCERCRASVPSRRS